MASPQNIALKKASILALFRRCIRSARNMPDPNQRDAYLIHVKDAFDRRSNLPLNSREALLAYRDGVEQVETMDYYHSQMKIKHIEKRARTHPEASRPATETAKDRLDRSAPGGTTIQTDVEHWLLLKLPHLNKEDMKMYSQRLVADGFDTVPFIEEELLDEDILFMKKAHRRVLARQLAEARASNDTGVSHSPTSK